jgi:hypothetical protein
MSSGMSLQHIFNCLRGNVRTVDIRNELLNRRARFRDRVVATSPY